MGKRCSVYIDEAGDLGVKRGTRWFVLSAIAVNEEDEPRIRAVCQSLKSYLNLNTIHFRNLRSFEQRCFVVDALYRIPFEHVHVVIDTNKIDLAKIPASDDPFSSIIYNYACRYLLERVSWMLRDTGRIGTVVLSSRGTTRDKELIDYIKKLLSYPANAIANVFSSVTCKQSSEWDMLQVADVCATSMFYAYEVNRFGFTIPCYIKRIQKSIYQYNGHYLNYGIKYFAEEMRPEADYFNEHTICKRG